MGVYDFLVLEQGVELPDWPLSNPPWQYSWQTRAFPDRAYRLHCLSADGCLYRVTHDYDDEGLVARDGGPDDPFEFLDRLGDANYDGQPRDVDGVKWHRVRFFGDLVAHCHGSRDPVSYEFEFGDWGDEDYKEVDQIRRFDSTHAPEE